MYFGWLFLSLAAQFVIARTSFIYLIFNYFEMRSGFIIGSPLSLPSRSKMPL